MVLPTNQQTLYLHKIQLINTSKYCFYSAPVGERYIVISLSVCVCLFVREHICGAAGPSFTNFFAQILCGPGSVLLWRRCDTLCTSGFMVDMTFDRCVLYGDAWLAALWYRGAVWCLWMPCIIHIALFCHLVLLYRMFVHDWEGRPCCC